VSYFKRFGCDVYCLDKSPNKGKFQPRSRKGILLGYSENSKAYRVWLREEKTIEITRDVKFLRDKVLPPRDYIETNLSKGENPLNDELKGREASEVDDNSQPLPNPKTQASRALTN